MNSTQSYSDHFYRSLRNFLDSGFHTGSHKTLFEDEHLLFDLQHCSKERPSREFFIFVLSMTLLLLLLMLLSLSILLLLLLLFLLQTLLLLSQQLTIFLQNNATKKPFIPSSGKQRINF